MLVITASSQYCLVSKIRQEKEIRKAKDKFVFPDYNGLYRRPKINHRKPSSNERIQQVY